MSARSRERWVRFTIVGMLASAYQNMRTVSEAKHLPYATRAEASHLATEMATLLERVRAETKEPTELSAKKGT